MLYSFIIPAGTFDSGSVLLNQNLNGCVRTYVNHSRTVAEWVHLCSTSLSYVEEFSLANDF